MKPNHYLVRRFPSLGFLRRKLSIGSSVAQSSSTTSLAGPNHGRNTSNSSSSNSSHQQEQPPGQATNQSHSVSASTVFPSLSRASTFTLTVTKGPSISSTNKPPPVSFVRPPKANPVFRRSVSLYERSGAPESTPVESKPSLLRRGGSIKQVIPIPPTKTRTVGRSPCTYDVTSTRPSRPRSASLPVDPALQTSTSQSTSRSEDEDTRSSHFSEAKEALTIKAHGVRRASYNRPLNASPSLKDNFSSHTPAPMALRLQGTSVTATPRAHNRYAAVYRPPPPLDADGYARAGHPKPALSLSMPTGTSIIESLPLPDVLLPPTVPASTGRVHSSRDPSPPSPYAQPFPSPFSSSSSPLASSRPPPRAPVPESPGASPENRSKPLPTMPTVSDTFTTAPSPTVALPHRSNAGLTPWARQRSHSAARIPNVSSGWTRDERSTGTATHNYLGNSNALNTGPNLTSDGTGGIKNSMSNKINYAQGGRLGTSYTRTVYTNTPTISISNQRRPSLPITPTASEFSIASTHTDESLWGYFERSGLTSSPNQSHELLRSRSANNISQTPSKGSHSRASIYEATLNASTEPLSTTTKSKEGSRGLGVNMGKSVHTVYVSSPSGSGSRTPQTPSSSSLQTPPLTSGTSPGSPYVQRRSPAIGPAPKIGNNSTTTSVQTIKLSSTHTIILREPPSTRPQRPQRPTHLISHSLPSPKVDSSFAIVAPPGHEQVLYLDPARSYAGTNIDSPSSFFNSPYPSPGVAFPATPMTPMTPWIGPGKNGDADADSLVLPPSPRHH
jgi:hypothetical protein